MFDYFTPVNVCILFICTDMPHHASQSPEQRHADPIDVEKGNTVPFDSLVLNPDGDDDDSEQTEVCSHRHSHAL